MDLDEILDTLPGLYTSMVTRQGIGEVDFRLDLKSQHDMNRVAAEQLIREAVNTSLDFEIGHGDGPAGPTGWIQCVGYIYTRDQMRKLLGHFYNEGMRAALPKEASNDDG